LITWAFQGAEKKYVTTNRQKQTTDMVNNIVPSNDYVTVSIFPKGWLWLSYHNVACNVIPIERR